MDISIQEVWEAAGGHPGIKPDKAELIQALKAMDEAIDHCDSNHLDPGDLNVGRAGELIKLAADGDDALSRGLGECCIQLQAFAATLEAPARAAWEQVAAQLDTESQELATRAASLQHVHAQFVQAPTLNVVWDGMVDGKQIGVLDALGTQLESLIGKTVKIIPVN